MIREFVAAFLLCGLCRSIVLVACRNAVRSGFVGQRSPRLAAVPRGIAQRLVSVLSAGDNVLVPVGDVMNVAQGKAASAATLGDRGQNNLGACGARDKDMSAASRLREFICRRHPRRKRRGYAKPPSTRPKAASDAVSPAARYKHAAPTEPRRCSTELTARSRRRF